MSLLKSLKSFTSGDNRYFEEVLNVSNQIICSMRQ